MNIVDYKPEYAKDFEEINRIWIEDYFTLEIIDEEILKNPYEHIIKDQGAILFAIKEGEILGTVGLKKHSDTTMELMKMGVYPKARNRGIGKLLINAAIDKAKEMGYTKLTLYSNRKLENAIHLYRKSGFEELKCYDDLYERCDIQMELVIT